MAGKTSILSIRILGDASNAKKELDSSAAAVDRFASGVDRAAVGAGVALAGIGAAAKTVFDAASELQQSQGAVQAIFAENADAIASLGANAADRLGLAQSEYGNLAALLGSQLKNMGTEADQLAPKTDELISLGADLAATYGGSTADAVAAVSSLMKGERDPIERYGVSIKQADIEAKKAALGLTGLTGEAAKAADSQATLALLTEQTSSAAGMFASEADTAAGAQARAQAAWEDSAAALGQSLLPIVSEVMGKLTEFAQWASENTGLITAIAATVGILAAGIIGLSVAMKLFALAQQVQTAIQWAQNAAWLASPVTWIVVAIVAVIAAIVLLWLNWQNVWQWMQDAARVVAEWFQAAWQAVADWFQSVWQAVADWFNSVWQSVSDFIGSIGDGIAATWESVTGAISTAVDSVGSWVRDRFRDVGDFIKTITDGIGNAWQSVVDWIRDLVGGVGDYINSVFEGVSSFIDGIVGGIRDAINFAGDLIGLSADYAPPVIGSDGVPSYITLGADVPNVLEFAATPRARELAGAVNNTGHAAASPTVINIKVDGALDPVAVGKQISDIMRRYRVVGAGT